MRITKFSKQVRFPRTRDKDAEIDCWWRENIVVSLYTESSDEESLKAINYLEKQIKKIQGEYQGE